MNGGNAEEVAAQGRVYAVSNVVCGRSGVNSDGVSREVRQFAHFKQCMRSRVIQSGRGSETLPASDFPPAGGKGQEEIWQGQGGEKVAAGCTLFNRDMWATAAEIAPRAMFNNVTPWLLR